MVIHSRADCSNSEHMMVNATLIHCPELFRSEVPPICVWVKKTFCLEAEDAASRVSLQASLSFHIPRICVLVGTSGYVCTPHSHSPHIICFSKPLISHPSFHFSLPVFSQGQPCASFSRSPLSKVATSSLTIPSSSIQNGNSPLSFEPITSLYKLVGPAF